jgi:hypothetical protein
VLLGGVLGFVNMAFVGAGADVWGRGTLRNGLVATALILPVFIFRHYSQDKGRFPSSNNQQDVVARAMTARWAVRGSCRISQLPWSRQSSGSPIDSPFSKSQRDCRSTLDI